MPPLPVLMAYDKDEKHNKNEACSKYTEGTK